MKFIQMIFIFTIFLNTMLHATNLRETIFIFAAGGALCKIYAEEVGGDEEAFSNMNVVVFKIAEKMGYANNLQSYTTEVSEWKDALKIELLKKHDSKLNIYNNWCVKLHDSFVKGIAKAYQ